MASWIDKSVTLKFVTTAAALGQEPVADRVLQLLLERNDELTPEKYDEFEPIKKVFHKDFLRDMIDLWVHKRGNLGGLTNLMFTRKKPYRFLMMVYWMRSRKAFGNWLSFSIEENFFADETRRSRFIEFAIQLYNILCPALGIIYHKADYEKKNIHKVLFDNGNEKSRETLGTVLTEGLPGVYWANLLNPTYVDFFGKEKLASVPCFSKKILGDSGYLLTTSSSPLEYASPDFEAAVDRVIKHLDKDAFFDIKQPERRCQVPVEVKDYAKSIATGL